MTGTDAVLIAPLPKCSCGADGVLFDAGQDPEISLFADIMTRRGKPVTARCLACWPIYKEVVANEQ